MSAINNSQMSEPRERTMVTEDWWLHLHACLKSMLFSG